MRACTWGLIGSLWLIVSVFPALSANYVAAHRRRDNSVGRYRPDIGRRRADHTAGSLLLDGMGEPCGAARNGKDWREGLARQADGVEQKGCVHLDIGFDAAARLAALQCRDGAVLDLDCEIETRGVRIEPPQRRAQQI